MNTLIIHIGASSDFFGGYAENCSGIYGSGATIEECKANTLEGLRLLVESRKREDLPDILQNEYVIEYHYDVQSILKYYSGIFSKSALERLTGINQKQLHHYASGMTKPRQAQVKKIESAFHKLGAELCAIHL
ncbi:MAG: hypothetical protein PHD11_03905 [Bacteroidales bacterium]|nr:hypothetical protein [Bacteroidales bacterium]MDD4670358.1 hypothetical protein [Bacteroidales bacterium]